MRLPTLKTGVAAVALFAGIVAATGAPVPGRAAEADQIYTLLLVDRLEYRAQPGGDRLYWDGQGWIGGDEEKLWLKTEGEKVLDGKLERAEFQALYSRLLTDFFDLQAGLRYDADPAPQRGFAVFGIQGLAPYFLDVEAHGFVSNEGEVSARFKVDYDLLLTQRLILQPAIETNLAVQSVRERGIGTGINNVELGLRLRYEIRREFAPYLGVNWERKVGETARFAREDGERVDALAFVAGIRAWF